MTKRAFDIIVSALALVVVAPLIAAVAAMIWREDGRWPFYPSRRVGRGDRDFVMVKLRSMIVDADKSGVSSTSSDNKGITAIGRFVRRYKLDELAQLWNVLKGDMSLVGPRPNVRRNGVDLYTAEEMRLLSVHPGITDLSSIVFADEGEILSGSRDPDLDYNRLIRPWKSRLGLLYVDRRTLALDLEIVWLTLVGIASRPKALASIQRILERLKAPPDLKRVCLRAAPLEPHAPPGAGCIPVLDGIA